MASLNFKERPFIVIWETTRACDLACVHCRAQAQPQPAPGELTHDEGIDLIDQVADFGAPLLIFSGGDPLKRGDLLSLIRHAKDRGLRVGTIPAATPRLTPEAVCALKQAGLDQMALSLDASSAEAHDRFRQVAGAFQRTMEAVRWAHAVKLPLQINSVISARSFADVDGLISLVQTLGIVFWEVFFLVPMGRGSELAGLDADQYEAVFEKLHRLSRTASFHVKVTEALHYRRYCLQHGQDRPTTAAFHGRQMHRGPIVPASRAVNAGNGHLFISSTGNVYPSGFLPLDAGNVRDATLQELYQTSLFQALRDPDRLKGRCGRCEYRVVCGGSRARAYALTGDFLAEDPCCSYQPPGALLPLVLP